MKTPLQELMEYMEQNQYFIGNDLLDKYKELIEKEKELIFDAYDCNNEICTFEQWQTMRLAKKQRSWDILGEKRTQLRWQIEELEQELSSESICDCGDTSGGFECVCNYNIEEDED